jgi:Ca-activated chloride channel homolog
MIEQLPGLACVDQRHSVVLENVTCRIHVEELLQTVHLSQIYRNSEEVAIEAVYTMPLPLEATLLDMKVSIGEKTLTGRVVEKRAAEEAYEDAVTSGDSGFLLTESAPGIYTMNVGNLMPGEEATIEIRYARLLRWSGDEIRISIPTTIAPRYGHPEMEPFVVPAFTTQERHMQVVFSVSGRLSSAHILSPTHAFSLARENGTTTLGPERVLMDRYIVFAVQCLDGSRAGACSVRDGEEVLVHASFCPAFVFPFGQNKSSPSIPSLRVEFWTWS